MIGTERVKTDSPRRPGRSILRRCAAVLALVLIGTIAAADSGMTRKAKPSTVTVIDMAGSSLTAVAPALHDTASASTSSGDPYARCTAGRSHAGVIYPATRVEPWLASDPHEGGHLIGVFQQDRWSDGGSRGLVASWSFDGGGTWGFTPLPFSRCADAAYAGKALPFERASDSWVSIGPDGTAYASGLAFDARDHRNAVVAATSSDGGMTWHNQQTVIVDRDGDPAAPFNDKDSVTADPRHPGTAYLVWDRVSTTDCGADEGLRPRRKSTPPPEHFKPPCSAGHAYLSMTTDGGRHWDRPRPIVYADIDQQTVANQIVVDSGTGTLYNFYDFLTPTDRSGDDMTAEIRLVFSTDRGRSWSPPQIVASALSVGVSDPRNHRHHLRTGDVIPEPAIDPITGSLYIAWQDARYRGMRSDVVVVSTSSQRGLTGTWTRPVRVDMPEDRAAFTPGISIDRSGEVAIDYYAIGDPRRDLALLPVERSLRISGRPLVRAGVDGFPFARFNFGPPVHLGGPFNMLAAPNAGGFFTGDYEGLAADADAFHAYFAQAACHMASCVVASAAGAVYATDITAVRAPRRQ